MYAVDRIYTFWLKLVWWWALSFVICCFVAAKASFFGFLLRTLTPLITRYPSWWCEKKKLSRTSTKKPTNLLLEFHFFFLQLLCSAVDESISRSCSLSQWVEKREREKHIILKAENKTVELTERRMWCGGWRDGLSWGEKATPLNIKHLEMNECVCWARERASKNSWSTKTTSEHVTL